jgi:hypothetical protein
MLRSWYDPVKLTINGMGSDGVQFLSNLSTGSVSCPIDTMYHTSLVAINFKDSDNTSRIRDVHVVAATVPAIHTQGESPIILWDTYFYVPETQDFITIDRLQPAQISLDKLIEFECASKPVISLVESCQQNKDSIDIMAQWAESLKIINYQNHPLGFHITKHWLERYNRHKLLEQMPETVWSQPPIISVLEQEILESKLYRGLDFENQTLLNKKWPDLFFNF